MAFTLGNGYIDLPSGYRWSSAGTSYQSGWTFMLKLPSGLMLQGGQATTTSATQGNGSISFPSTFPNACIGVYLIEGGANGWGSASPGGGATNYAICSFNTTGATFSGAWVTAYDAYFASSIGCNWLAIGY